MNTERKIAMAARIERAAGGSVRGKTIAVFGVTFKPNTDDMRDAPSLVIVPLLAERGAIVRAYDPQGRKQARAAAAGHRLVRKCPRSREGADVAVVMTEWNEFRALDLRALKKRMRGNVLVDLRNVFRPDYVQQCGFVYSSIGRPLTERLGRIPKSGLPGFGKTPAKTNNSADIRWATKECLLRQNSIPKAAASGPVTARRASLSAAIPGYCPSGGAHSAARPVRPLRRAAAHSCFSCAWQSEPARHPREQSGLAGNAASGCPTFAGVAPCIHGGR